MKICNKCNIEKSLDAFVFDNSKGRYTPSCKECRATVLRKRRDANREEYNTKTAEWRQRTLEKQRENRKKWREDNKLNFNLSNRKSYHRAKDDEHLEFFIQQLESQQND